MQYAKPTSISLSGPRQWPDRKLDRSPVWCAVDLRDGNQALPDPLTPEQKHRYFQLLCELGFKEIEIGFPSASADDFNFCRELIEKNLIPADVTISVLTQAREHLIRRTMEALQGCRRAIFHFYTATSDLHMRWVFGKTPEETKKMALEATRLARELSRQQSGQILLEFSPEEFTDSNLDYVLDVCDSVVETWNPGPDEKVILNLPATVERRLPFEYADMIEEFCRRQKHRARSIISLHAHNDMGTAVAASEMALMAGADRVEGTLFGHGERSGNVDLVTLVMNLQYLGIDTGISFKEIEKVRDEVAHLTSMPVNARHPYAGELVFSAFSGSHQDAIHKGFQQKEEMRQHYQGWKIPYLHIDPKAIGRSYEKFIRINSQSGKGGIAHILMSEYNVKLPRDLLVDFSKHVQAYADKVQREVGSAEVWTLFKKTYVEPASPTVRLLKYWPRPDAEDPGLIVGELHVEFQGTTRILHGSGQGPIAAFVHALNQLPLPKFTVADYKEDTMGHSADADALATVRVSDVDGRSAFGAGMDSNINQAAVLAVTAAINNLCHR